MTSAPAAGARVAGARWRSRLRVGRAQAGIAFAATFVLAAEWARGRPSAASGRWFALEAVVMGAALIAAWYWQSDLHRADVLVGAVLFQVALIVVRDHVRSPGDIDVNGVYQAQGHALLHGHYPHSEYPPGAVLLFGFEDLVGRGHTRTANMLSMVAFQAIVVACVLALRTPSATWLAALLAFWPANIYFWQYRFDLAPTAFLAAGLLLALRRRLGFAGAALGVGAALKWTPAIACMMLLVWLVASRRPRDAIAHAAGFMAAFAALNVPFLIWDSGAVLHAYTAQGLRTVTAESFLFPVLHVLGYAQLNESGLIWDSAEAPGWANGVVLVVQGLLLLVGVLLAVRCRRHLAAGIAVAALAPSVFLLDNRIFSPQFAVVFMTCTAIAAALLVRNSSQQLLVGLALLCATGANALVYPARIQHWLLASTVFFAVAFAVSAYLASLAWRDPARHPIRS